jgi:hypothetical protein
MSKQRFRQQLDTTSCEITDLQCCHVKKGEAYDLPARRTQSNATERRKRDRNRHCGNEYKDLVALCQQGTDYQISKHGSLRAISPIARSAYSIRLTVNIPWQFPSSGSELGFQTVNGEPPASPAARTSASGSTFRTAQARQKERFPGQDPKAAVRMIPRLPRSQLQEGWAFFLGRL